MRSYLKQREVVPLENSGAKPDNGELPSWWARPGRALSRWLEATKPYRELVAIVVAVCVAVSASVSWAVSYFATQNDIANLECRVFDYVEEKGAVPVFAITSEKLRRLQAGLLLEQDHKNAALATKLFEQADIDAKDRLKFEDEARQKFRTAMVKCLPYLRKP